MAHKILLIDDSLTARQVVTSILTQAGYEVVTMASTLGVLNALELEQPHLLLMDVNMPALTGDQSIRIARERGALDGTWTVLLSGAPEQELRQLQKECGADGFIQKTTDQPAFVASVARWMNRERRR